LNSGPHAALVGILSARREAKQRQAPAAEIS
jgi:hypothetical protein